MKNNIVLIVDDVEINRDILAELFSSEYVVLEAAGGEEAMSLIAAKKDEIAVILLDLIMPGKNGYDVLDFMRFNRYTRDIPVVLITATDSKSAEVEGLKRGASDFINKPFDASIVRQRVRNMIELYRYKRSLERIIERQTEKFAGITEFVIDVLVSVMQVKNSGTRRSIQRVRAYTKELLSFIYEFSDEKYGLTAQEISLISTASILHDIGELLVPEHLITKQIQLSAQERALLESHTVIGCEIIESLGDIENQDYMQTALQICRHHHERWDGSGYPDKLVGNEIPISAQVVGLADTYDALREGVKAARHYSHAEAVEAITHGEAGAFSPLLTESCKMLGDRLDEIYRQYKD